MKGTSMLPWLSWMDFVVAVAAIIVTPLVGCVGSSFSLTNAIRSYIIAGGLLVFVGAVFSLADYDSSWMNWFVLGWVLIGIGVTIKLVRPLFAGLFTATHDSTLH